MKYIIKWTNKYSHETGYVGKIMAKAGHFVNVTNKKDAKTFKTEKDAEKDIKRLVEIGEAENNHFEVLEVK